MRAIGTLMVVLGTLQACCARQAPDSAGRTPVAARPDQSQTAPDASLVERLARGQDPCGPGGDNSVMSKTTDGATTEMRVRDLGTPGANVHVLRTEAFFRAWPAVCGAPECTTTFPEGLKSTEYQKRLRIDDPALVERLWKDYVLARASSACPPSGCYAHDDCADDAKIMVVFCTSEPAERWLAAGNSAACGQPLMVTEDYRFHARNGPIIRDLAEAIDVKDKIESEMPEIFR
jgi:hypothetical protein